MTSSISFGDTNSGFQVGTNHGSIDAQFHLAAELHSKERSEVYNTQGGAVFSGNISAKRDINIYHITTVRPLADSIYKSLFNSADLFDQVRNELGLLVAVLNATEEHTQKFHLDDTQLPNLNDALNRCHGVLRELSELKDRFDNVGPQTRVTWERMGWGEAELVDIRTKLLLYIQVLNVLNTNMIRSSHENVEHLLKTFISEIRSGKRESAAMSCVSTGSLTLDEREAWRHLRKELQSIGITPDIFTQHRGFILTTLQTFLSQDGIEDCPVNVETANFDQKQSSPESPRENTDSTSRTGTRDDVSATMVAHGNNDRSKGKAVGTEYQSPLDILALARIPKKPNRMARLLHRITHPNAEPKEAMQTPRLNKTKQMVEEEFASAQATRVPYLTLSADNPSDESIVSSKRGNDPASPLDLPSGTDYLLSEFDEEDEMPKTYLNDGLYDNGQQNSEHADTLSQRQHVTGWPGVLFPVASLYEFNLDSGISEGGYTYLTYNAGELFGVVAEKGNVWLAYNQDDPTQKIGWIWDKHFTKLERQY
ncbi:uncharacterized protein N7482_008883 [Penicillium canariense]|uniref:Uncharacterized protein n=1 Tax=Penicillium canariense TaxID=189055 RepID=A0A9W9LIZ1_9EURO|nr:uncharacterized protein N7482_008883 [Penicillium canariense]KAJ5157783.1 hypothetical protein N7482_008883 [Penicillium canariense]